MRISGARRKARPAGHIAHGYAKHQGCAPARQGQHPVPAIAPRSAFALAAELERHGAQDQADQHGKHGQVKARERDGIQLGPGGKDGAAAQNQPHLVAFPHGADGVDHHAAFHIGFARGAQQRGGAQVKTVGHCKADQQNAQQQPPDDAQHVIAQSSCKIMVLTPSVTWRCKHPRTSSCRPAGEVHSLHAGLSRWPCA